MSGPRKLNRRQALALLGAGAAGTALAGKALAEAGLYTGAPMLDGAISAGDLPPVGHRLPLIPQPTDWHPAKGTLAFAALAPLPGIGFIGAVHAQAVQLGVKCLPAR